MPDYFINKTDSRFFGQNLVGWKFNDENHIPVVKKHEVEILQKYQPAMISVFIPVNYISSVHAFSKMGYDFMECRLFVQKELDGHTKSYSLYPYEFIEITSRKELNNLLKIFDHITFDDRFFADPEIDNKLAIKRNIFFLEQSLKRKYERIFILQNSNNNEILGFRSLKFKDNKEVDMLISGIVQEKTEENIQELINVFELQILDDMGVQQINMVISAKNYDEINRYLSKYNYIITDSKLVLRKILKPFSSL